MAASDGIAGTGVVLGYESLTQCSLVTTSTPPTNLASTSKTSSNTRWIAPKPETTWGKSRTPLRLYSLGIPLATAPTTGRPAVEGYPYRPTPDARYSRLNASLAPAAARHATATTLTARGNGASGLRPMAHLASNQFAPPSR